MAFKFVLATVLLVVGIQEIHGHGKLMDPVSRSSAWRKNFNTPPNYTDNELFCGGLGVKTQNGGKCGTCGDNYRDPVPRANENGGKYGTGTIVKTYKQGQRMQAVVDLNAAHLGYFEFAVCPLNGPKDVETEECFAKHPVQLANGSYQHKVGSSGKYTIDLVLPQGLSCEHCSFRWHYNCGNQWGRCEDGTGRLGCGPQEYFRGCADITIQ